MAAKKKTSPKKTSKKASDKSPRASAKKGSTKKSASKKTAAAKLTPGVKKLVSLAETLTKDEIEFLISQAETMIRNHAVIERREKKLKNRDKVAAAMDPVKNKSTIEIIEGEEGRHFIIVLGTERNFFSREEMKKLVKLCHAASDERDGMRRIYTWLERFRSDLIRDNDFGSSADPGLATIYNKIIETYMVGD